MRHLVFAVLVAGCAPTTAVVAGKTVPRIDLDYYGQPFAVEVTNAHPEPGSPSGGLRDFGGHVSGNVCGLELSYEIVHDGDKTKAIGYVDNNNAFESTIYVHDEKDMTRKISGRLVEQGGTVDLTLRKNHIYGVVGQRQFAFGRRGDQYIGWLKIRQSVLAKAVINGADSLWTMPPATQAVVLPALLTCYGDNIEDHLGRNFQIGFGGHQSWEARHVSALYHENTMDEQRTFNQAFRESSQMLSNGLETMGGKGPKGPGPD